jgi:glycosyltransferase involved in cell wall biosynthesis
MVASAATATDEASRIKREVEAAVEELPNLCLFGDLPRPELMRLASRAVAMVSTSEFEGMSNVLLEGWARGVPALVFSYDSDGIVLRHGLGRVAGGSEEQFAQAAHELWSGRHSRQELSQRCREYVEEHHAPERIAEQWAAVLATTPVPVERRTVAVETA